MNYIKALYPPQELNTIVQTNIVANKILFTLQKVILIFRNKSLYNNTSPNKHSLFPLLVYHAVVQRLNVSLTLSASLAWSSGTSTCDDKRFFLRFIIIQISETHFRFFILRAVGIINVFSLPKRTHNLWKESLIYANVE